ncbi:MAG TPA: iron-sulfur cluster assembly scaffold protein [Ignavibacteriales bacterium]|nr:iron-sulfur cluster assembly scaffold protein [Ignavibacteriales bacterium]
MDKEQEERLKKQIDGLMQIGYSDKAIFLILFRTNFGTIENADICAEYKSECGDMLILYLKVDNEIITNAKFEYVGCVGLQVSASALTEMLHGISLEAAAKIKEQDILDFLENIPVSKYECICLALNTLKKGLDEHFAGGKI